MGNKQLKKSLLATVLFTGALFSTAAIVDETRTQQNNVITSSYSASTRATRPDDTLLLWSPWSANGTQDKALRTVVDTYNNSLTDSAKEAGAMPVEVFTFTGGYSGITSQIQQDLKAGNYEALPDIYINYADTTSSLIEFGINSSQKRSFALDIQETVPGISDEIIPSMAAQNEMIAGGEEGAIYTIPFATSSELMGIDAPTFVWMLQQYINKGGSIVVEGDVEVMRQVIDAADSYKDGSLTKHDEDGDTYKESGDIVYEDLASAGAKEASVIDQSTIESVEISKSTRSTIETYWQAEGDATGRTITITEDTFSSAEGMLELSTELLTIVGDKTKNELSRNSGQAIYGYDSAVNNFYTYGQGLTKSLENPENGLIVKEGDEVIFEMLEEDSEAWNASIEILDYFINAFNSGSAWTKNGGVSYGSDLIKNHQMPFSIGSTAGATYYYGSDVNQANAGEIVYTQAPGKLKKDGDINVQMQQGPSIGGIDNGDEARTEAVGAFMNFLVSSTEYDFIIPGETEYVDYENFDEYKGLVYKEDGTTPLADAEWPLKEEEMYSDKNDFNNSYGNTHAKVKGDPTDSSVMDKYYGFQKEEDALDGYVKTPDGVYKNYSSYYGYWKFDAPGTEDFVIADGNYGLQVFDFDGTTATGAHKAQLTPDEGGMMTPASFMSSQSNYIVGTESVFTDSDYTDQLEDKTIQSNGVWEAGTFTPNNTETTKASEFNDKGLIGPSIAYKNISESDTEGSGVELELEPYSINTSSYRSEIDSQLKQIKEDAVNGKKPKEAEDILIDVHNKAIDQGWFEGSKILVWEWWMTMLCVLAALTVIGGIAILIWYLVGKNKGSKNTI